MSTAARDAMTDEAQAKYGFPCTFWAPVYTNRREVRFYRVDTASARRDARGNEYAYLWTQCGRRFTLPDDRENLCPTEHDARRRWAG